MKTFAWAAALLFTLAPRLALACPACAGRDEGGVTKVFLLGAMILLPFGVALVTGQVIRRALQDDSTESP
ncbi:MAG: hypothetical protein ACOZIN_19070 [Myxococcota bacterium]